MNRRRTPLNPVRGIRPHPLSLSIPSSTRCRWARPAVPLITFPTPTPGVHRLDPFDLAMRGLQYGVASLMVFLWLCAVFL
ncbi:MAG: hypothetical protein ACO3I0_10415 [Limisphaerales bacterium]